MTKEHPNERVSLPTETAALRTQPQSRKDLNNASVLLLHEAVILKSKLPGLSLEHAQRRTHSHVHTMLVLRVPGASGVGS